MPAGSNNQRNPRRKGLVGDVAVCLVQDEPLFNSPEPLVRDVAVELAEDDVDNGCHQFLLAFQIAEVEVAVAGTTQCVLPSVEHLTATSQGPELEGTGELPL